MAGGGDGGAGSRDQGKGGTGNYLGRMFGNDGNDILIAVAGRRTTDKSDGNSVRSTIDGGAGDDVCKALPRNQGSIVRCNP